MTILSKWTLFWVVGIFVCTWNIFNFSDNSAQAQDKIQFIRYYQGDRYSNGPILHGSYNEGESFFLLENKSSKVCNATSTKQFIYDDTDGAEIAFKATKLTPNITCSDNSSYFIAIHSDNEPIYEPLSYVNTFNNSHCIHYPNHEPKYSVCPNDTPLLYYQSTESRHGKFEFFVYDNIYNNYEGRALTIFLDGLLLERVDIGWSNIPPHVFFLDKRLFIRTYWNNQGGWEFFRNYEITTEGLTLLLSNDDFSS